MEGPSPLGSSTLSRRAIQEIKGSGEKERKKDESTDFRNVEQNWSLLSAQEVTNRGGQYDKKVNNSALAARVSYADRVRFPGVIRGGSQGGSPIPCLGGSPAGPLSPCSDGIQIMQVCGNCDADSGYPASANRYGWWCANSFDEAVKMLGFTQNCKVKRVVSQEECCNRSW